MSAQEPLGSAAPSLNGEQRVAESAEELDTQPFVPFIGWNREACLNRRLGWVGSLALRATHHWRRPSVCSHLGPRRTLS